MEDRRLSVGGPVPASSPVSMLNVVGAAESGLTAHRRESLLDKIISVFVDSEGPKWHLFIYFMVSLFCPLLSFRLMYF